ncbi:MAG: helix-turn-helix domain-containing protein [Planctomycetes bacterium]|nr:helix-turn-helix domain-containing protein [Planctomycetota bacterium]
MDSTIETSLAALVTSLGISATIIDRNGIFHTTAGSAILSHYRQSHRKNEICRIGFCQRCIDHCRYEMNAEGVKKGKPFIHTCWKDVSEIVIPLIRDGRHFGSLFAGVWRARKKPRLLHELPEEFAEAYNRLPAIPQHRIADLTAILSVYARGMLEMLDERSILTLPDESRQQEIIRFVRYNATEGIGLNDLARQLNLSPSRTSHLVKELFGESFSELLTQERIRHAQSLLEGTELMVKEIAASAGFGDPYHFNKVFKKQTGLPPGAYRSECRKKNGADRYRWGW